ncbi:MAG: hypothetical protein I8H75_00375 [Myxococcaceae bacterium]|nr:hypothetical protein [Myxococcaceae bacterium]MBH2005800.1 hypothetical protein [Myxococcaceae bacterium]
MNRLKQTAVLGLLALVSTWVYANERTRVKDLLSYGQAVLESCDGAAAGDECRVTFQGGSNSVGICEQTEEHAEGRLSCRIHITYAGEKTVVKDLVSYRQALIESCDGAIAGDACNLRFQGGLIDEGICKQIPRYAEGKLSCYTGSVHANEGVAMNDLSSAQQTMAEACDGSAEMRSCEVDSTDTSEKIVVKDLASYNQALIESCDGSAAGAQCDITFQGGLISIGICVQIPGFLGKKLSCEIDPSTIPSCKNSATGTPGMGILLAILVLGIFGFGCKRRSRA